MVKRVLKKIPALLVVITAGLMLSVILVFSLLTTGPGENFVRGVIEDRLNKTLNQQVAIGKLETNLVSRLQLEQVEVFQIAGKERTDFLKLRYAVINYRIWELLKRKLPIESITVDSLELSVLRDSSGSFNFPALAAGGDTAAGEAPFAVEVELGSFVLNAAKVSYQDRIIPLEGSLSDIGLALQQEAADHFRFRIQAGAGGLAYLGKPLSLDSLALEGSWEDRQLRLANISIRLPGIECAGAFSVDLKTAPLLLGGNLSLKGELAPAAQIFRDYLPPQFLPLKGQVAADLSLEGTLEDPGISFKVDLADLQAADLPIRVGLLEGQYRQKQIKLDQLRVELLDGSVSGQGLVILDSTLNHQLALSMSGISLTRLSRFISRQPSPYQGVIKGKIETAGSLRSPEQLQASARISLQQVKYQSRRFPDFNAGLFYQKNLLNLEIQQENSTIRAAIERKDEKLSGEFILEIFNLEPFVGFFNISELDGALSVRGNIAGTLEKPEIKASFSGKGINYQNLPLDSVWGGVTYRNQQLSLEQTAFSGVLDSVDSLSEPFHLTGLYGGLSYKGSISGGLDRLQGELIIQLFQPGYKDFRFEKGKLDVAFTHERAELKSLVLERDSLILELSGEYSIPSASGNLRTVFSRKLSVSDSLEARSDSSGEPAEPERPICDSGIISAEFDISSSTLWRIDLEGSGLKLQDVLILSPEPLPLGGNLHFSLEFEGSLESPSAGLYLSVDSLSYQQAFLDSLRGNFRLEDNRLHCENLEGFLLGNKTRATGEIELVKKAEGFYTISDNCIIRGGIEGRDIDLQLLSLFLDPEMQLSGYSTYRLEWEGALKRPHLKGELEIRDGMIKVKPETPPIQAVQASVLFEDSVFQFPNISGIIQEMPFRVKGKMTVRDWAEYHTQLNLDLVGVEVLSGNGTLYEDSLHLDLELKDFELSLLQAFAPELKKLSGTAVSTLRIDGPFSDPEVTGNLLVSNLSFQLPLLDAPFTNGLVKINLDKNVVKLDSLSLALNGGSISASGQLAHQERQLTQLNLELFIKDVKVERPKAYTLVITSAQLSYRKHDNYYDLGGDIVLGETHLIYNFPPKALLGFMQKVERPAEELPAIVQQTRLDVRLRESENIWINTNLARLHLHSELGFIGTLSHPNVAGRLSAVEGYVLYLDRKFKVQSGTMDFVDPNRMNPFIDFKAEASVRTYQKMEAIPYTINLAISGPLDQAKVELTSDPPLDRSDIIALLTVGGTREQLAGRDAGGEGSSVNDIMVDRAGTITSQKLSQYITGNVAGTLGLEELSVEGNLFGRGKSGGAQLLASQKISDRVGITYTTNVGHLNEQSIRLDYNLSRYFSMEGKTDQRSRSSIVLKYRLRFQ